MSKRKSSQRQKRIHARFENTVCNLGRKLNNVASSVKEANSIDSDMSTKSVDQAEMDSNVMEKTGVTGEMQSGDDVCTSSGGDNGMENACGSSMENTVNSLDGKNQPQQPDECTVSQTAEIMNVQSADITSDVNGNNDKVTKTSYADMTKNNIDSLSNKLSHIPTKLFDDGTEVIIFYEDMVKEGSKKWDLTACGYFVGYRMYSQEINYHLFRMWGRHGLKSIMGIGNGTFVFKFNSE